MMCGHKVSGCENPEGFEPLENFSSLMVLHSVENVLKLGLMLQVMTGN